MEASLKLCSLHFLRGLLWNLQCLLSPQKKYREVHKNDPADLGQRGDCGEGMFNVHLRIVSILADFQTALSFVEKINLPYLD